MLERLTRGNSEFTDNRTSIWIQRRFQILVTTVVLLSLFVLPWYSTSSAQTASTYLAAFSINNGNGTMNSGNLALDYAVGQVQPVGKSTSSSYRIEAGSVPVMAQTSSVPTQLGFTIQPGNATAGNPLSIQPKVSVENAAGDTITSSTAQITLAITPGSGSENGVLSGTKTVEAVNGIATFSGLSINTPGVGYTLTATTTEGLTSVISYQFSIVAFGAGDIMNKSIFLGLFGCFVFLFTAILLRRHRKRAE